MEIFLLHLAELLKWGDGFFWAEFNFVSAVDCGGSVRALLDAGGAANFALSLMWSKVYGILVPI